MCCSEIATHAVRNHWLSITKPINVIAQKSDRFLSIFYFSRYIAADKGYPRYTMNFTIDHPHSYPLLLALAIFHQPSNRITSCAWNIFSSPGPQNITNMSDAIVRVLIMRTTVFIY